MPVIKTKKALQEMGENGIITVLVDNIEAVENIEKMLKEKSDCLYVTGESGYNFSVKITKGDGASVSTAKKEGGAVVVLSSNKMGKGDDELGETLLKMFIYSLTESDTSPKSVICYNSGVKVTTTGGASLESLRNLSEMGVDILSCGACLKHYDLSESLEVGRVSNMYEISEILLNASNVITI